ncbi:MAG: hypothetical protein EP346_09020 [Bacteroidetes bacterium]|nr:MAG: hypothetical protein EP346_09020 [Bacteroidota bacterium]
MKASVYVACMGMSFCTSAQGTWFDSFSDHSLGRNPAWSGDTSNFIQSSDEQLQLNDSNAGESWIYAPSAAEKTGIWSGFIAMDFNPSSANFATLVLCDDTLGNTVELRVGGQSADRVELVRNTGAQSQTLLQSPVDYLDLASVTLFWEVRRSPNHYWTLNLNRDSTSWEYSDSAFDDQHFSSQRFGIGAKYTKTRATKVFWDDIHVNGIPYRDTIPPKISAVEWKSRTRLDIQFSKGILQFPSTVVDNQSGIWTVSRNSNSEFILLRNSDVSDGTYQISLESFIDNAGLPADTLQTTLVRPTYRWVHFSEIHYNANTESPWPHEYFELYALASDSVSLKNWTVRINEKNYPLPDTAFVGKMAFANGPLEPNAYVMNFSSLPNSGGTLVLLDDWNEVIDYVEYNPSWHSSSWKDKSGWSLERNESRPSCETESAWSSAGTDGGSPGLENNPETNLYAPLNALEYIAANDTGFTLQFAFPLLQLLANGQPSIATNLTRRNWHISDTGQVQLHGDFCGGFDFDTTATYLGAPEIARHLRITELLVEPVNDIPEFIEIVNFGNFTIDLEQVYIGRWSVDNGAEDLVGITANSTLLGPWETAVICDEPLSLFSHFAHSNPRAHVYKGNMVNLPSNGGLCLVNSEGTMLDSTRWSQDSYHPLTDKNTSVSLRRIQFTSSETAWTSTSTGSGNATPGIYRFHPPLQVDEPSLERAQFSPNNDGIYDELIIHLPDSWGGKSCSLNILTADGQPLAHPLKEVLIAKGDVLRWDGFDENRKTLVPGQYLIEIQTLSSDGSTVYWYHGCLLTSQ